MTADQESPSTQLFLPLLIALVSLVIFVGGLTIASIDDYSMLVTARNGQTNVIQQDVRMRQQLTALAGGVARMAQSGDPDAQSIVDQFAKNGIKLAPPAQSTAPTPSK
jgi:hypothetical protein